MITLSLKINFKWLSMLANWVKEPAVWCDPWPGHVLGVVGSRHDWSAYKLIILDLINCIVVRVLKIHLKKNKQKKQKKNMSSIGSRSCTKIF